MSTVVVECIIGSAPVVTGSSNPVTGLSAGSTTVTCDDFEGYRITLKRGGLRVRSIPSAFDTFYSKLVSDNFFDVDQPFVTDEVVYVQTII